MFFLSRGFSLVALKHAVRPHGVSVFPKVHDWMRVLLCPVIDWHLG